MVLEKILFKSHNKQKITVIKYFNKQRWIKLQHLRKPIGPVNNETKSRPHKNNNKLITKPKLQKNLHCSRHYNCSMLPARTVNRRFLLSSTSKGFTDKRTTKT